MQPIILVVYGYRGSDKGSYLLRLEGTFAPTRRASEIPMATACFLLVTFLPLRPLFNVPRLYSRITRPIFLFAFGPYFDAIIL